MSIKIKASRLCVYILRFNAERLGYFHFFCIINLNKEIFRIAIPNIISNISIPLLGIVDTALMGRMDDPAYIGAIALGGVVFNILYWGFGFLRPGTTGLTAQAYGAGDLPTAYRYFVQAFSIGLFFGLLLLLLHVPIGRVAYSLLNGSQQVKDLSYQYFSIRILAAPAVITLFAFRGWFFGMQNALAPMALTIVANVINIFLSWYLVMHCDMGVQGVAIGTVVAQYTALLLAFSILLYRHKKAVFLQMKRSAFRLLAMQRFLNVNRDMFLRNIGMILVFSFFTNYSAGISEQYLAVNEILLQLFYFMSYSVDGFAYAAEALVGRHIGAQSLSKVKIVVRRTLYYGLGFGCLFALLYLLFGDLCMRIFTDNTALILIARPYYIWLALVAICGALAFVWDGIYGGATASVELRNAMFFSVISFFLVFYLFQSAYPGHAVWLGMIAFMLARSLFQIFYYKRKIIGRL